MSQAHFQAKTPHNIAMAAQNAILEIRHWQAEHQTAMSDTQQLRVIMDHIGDFIRGRAFVSDHRKETLRAFVEFLCPDQECIDALEIAIEEKRAA